MVVIKVENVFKQYRLGQVGTGTLGHDLNRLWHRMRGKEDPYLKIGEENDRTKSSSSQYVWALQEINFEVEQGEVLGIIGRNGAGKSTLLKILSRTTLPTKGEVRMKGRIASLLEVGTGFHPDLSGRDNIYLNGAILGMTKKEVRSKFDEIVDFAGVERYIDTPVKRYSSGMYVRLAFAVAAHLDPEILIVDEVLSVGDSEFQKKCLGKMKDISQSGGRTVLFVSHNMGSIAQLCTSSLLLYQGRMVFSGETNSVIDKYLSLSASSSKYRISPSKEAGKVIYFSEITCVNTEGIETDSYKFDENITVRINAVVKSTNLNNVKVGIALLDRNETRVFSSLADLTELYTGKENTEICVKLPANLFAPGSYKFLFALHIPNQQMYDLVENVCDIKIFDSGTEFHAIEGFHYGNIIIKPDWYAA
jgi:lipopolysaccharide transport system ATP-binding protein